MARDYIEKREGSYWIAGTRVSFDSVAYAFLRGAAPESIAQSFPVLSLEEVYGAIAFYLANQAELDTAFADSDREFERLRRQTREANPRLYKKLEEARQQQKMDLMVAIESLLLAWSASDHEEWVNRIVVLLF